MSPRKRTLQHLAQASPPPGGTHSGHMAKNLITAPLLSRSTDVPPWPPLICRCPHTAPCAVPPSSPPSHICRLHLVSPAAALYPAFRSPELVRKLRAPARSRDRGVLTDGRATARRTPDRSKRLVPGRNPYPYGWQVYSPLPCLRWPGGGGRPQRTPSLPCTSFPLLPPFWPLHAHRPLGSHVSSFPIPTVTVTPPLPTLICTGPRALVQSTSILNQ